MAEERGNRFAGLGLVGGRLCLDFANTVGWRTGERRYDHLDSFADLVEWGVHAGAIDETAAEALRRWARSAPEAATAAFEEARVLREAIYAIFSAVARGEAAPAGALEVLNRVLSEAMSQARLSQTAEGFEWGWGGAEVPVQVVWPVARSAAELLTSAEVVRIGECAGEHCGWIYLDTSRNRSRRWCDMRDCGNRAKVRRHYRRKREPSG